MVFQLQPAPSTRSFNKNRPSLPRTPRSRSPASNLSNSEDSSPFSQDEGAESDRSRFQTSSRYQEHFSWGTLPGTASLGKPGVPAFAPLDQMPRRRTSKLNQIGKLELSSLNSEVEHFSKLRGDTRLLVPSNRPRLSVVSVELEYEGDEDITPGSTPVSLMISPKSQTASPQATAPTSVRGSTRNQSSAHSDSMRSLNEDFDFLSKEEAERALLNSRLSASAGSMANNRRGGETRSWNKQSFTSSTKSPTSNGGSLVRRRSSVKSPTSAEIQILSFGDQQEGQELQITTTRYDRPASNFLSLPAPSNHGSKRHTSLQFPPMSPISPRSAAAQHSPSTLAPSTSQPQHLSIGTAPLSATLLALGVNRKAHHYTRGNDSFPSDDDEEVQTNPRWSVPFWARRDEVLDQQSAAEKNKKAIRDGNGLSRITEPGQEPSSPNGGVLEMSNVSNSTHFNQPSRSGGVELPSTSKFLEVPPPIRQRGTIESTVRAGRLAASRLSASLASFISGNGSTSGSQRGGDQGWLGALPFTKRSSPDGWGGGRASWFPSSNIGPLIFPSPDAVKSSPKLKSLHLSPSTSANSSSRSFRNRPGLKVHFAPVENERSKDTEINENDWVDEDEAQELLDSPNQTRNYSQTSAGSPISSSSKFKRGFTASNLFRRRSSGSSLRSPTSPINFIPPPPPTFNGGYPSGFKSFSSGEFSKNSQKISKGYLDEEDMNEGTSVTYWDGSAEGRLFRTRQQIESQRKKTAIHRKGTTLMVLIFLAVLINIIVLDFKLLSKRNFSSIENQSQTSKASDSISNLEPQKSTPASIELNSLSASNSEPSSLTSVISSTLVSSDSLNQSPSSTPLSSSLPPSLTPTSVLGASNSISLPSSPVSIAVEMSGRDRNQIALGKASDRQAYRFFGVRRGSEGSDE